MKHKCLGLMAAILCGCAIVSYGRVFFRWGSAAQSTRAMEVSGGKIAYKTGVILNGGAGQLTVLSFDQSIGEVVRELGQIFNTGNITYSGGEMAFASINFNGRVIRLVIVRLDDYMQTIVFKLEQSAREFKLSSESPAGHLTKNMPAYPESEPVFYGMDENTRMSMALSRTRSAPAAVYDFFESRLTASGWISAVPTARKRINGVAIYMRENEIGCVCVDPSNVSGESRIMLLYKRQGLK